MQPLDPRDRHQCTRTEPELSGRVAVSLDEAEGYESLDEMGMQTGLSGEAVEAEKSWPRDGICGHRRVPLGSNVDTVANSSKSSPSRSLSVLGTITFTSA